MHSLKTQALAARLHSRIGEQLERYAMDEKHGPEKEQRTGETTFERDRAKALEMVRMYARIGRFVDAADVAGLMSEARNDERQRCGDGISERAAADGPSTGSQPGLAMPAGVASAADDRRERATPQSWVIRRADGLYLDAMGGPTPPGQRQLPRWVPLEDAVTYRTEQSAVEDMLAHYWFEPGPMRVVGIVLHPSWREALESSGGGEK